VANQPKFFDAEGRLLVVSVAAVNSKGYLLFGKRGDTQKFTLPGGHLNQGEHPPVGAVRELFEETGLRAQEIHFLGHGDISGGSGGNPIRVYSYRARVDDQEPSADQDPDKEFVAFEWIKCAGVGLPDHINHHLQHKDDVTLKYLGIQRGELRTDDTLGHKVPVVYNTLLQLSEKGMPKNQLAGVLLAGSLVAAPINKQEVPPVLPPPPSAHMGELNHDLPKVQWDNRGFGDCLSHISHLESDDGKYLDHEPNSKGEWFSAFGPLGLKPSTAHERYILNPSLQRKFPGNMPQDTFMYYFKNEPEFYKAVARTHWRHLLNASGQDIGRTAFSWRWGEEKMRRTPIDEIENDPYVRKFRQLHEQHEPHASLEKFQSHFDFPKLGVVSRRETPMIGDKQAYLTRAKASLGQTALKMYPDAKPEARTTAVNREATKLAGQKSVLGYNQTYGGGAVRTGKLLTPERRAGVNVDVATKEHEDLHGVFSNIDRKYGPRATHNLRMNIFHSLPKNYQDLLTTHLTAQGGQYESLPYGVQTEEKMAHLLNYLNSGYSRDKFHNTYNHDPARRKQYSLHMKRAHQYLRAAADVADQRWLEPGFIKAPWAKKV
jgi:8-oxo-dGTP pyrophosphatase MutT (NUDIX family)